ncbi:CHAT domain-containing protein [Mesonia hippocampi]|uniref:CHAT domain-containing protein n=1 Tax=Mesonia hippocampi TaxID=1628250 RepID=A0A840EGJ5_9FLAO|nr:CHAT domain-containing protein [Mesonia hippocampi]MBB4118372.1 CHAT domain-containing protein [Mesonia hippocampi]
MKNKIVLIFAFLLTSIHLFSQNEWDLHTKKADSLDLNFQFQAALNYRTKALELADKAPDSTQKMLRGLQLFTKAEASFSFTKKSNIEAYQLMQNAIDTLQEANAAPERMSRVNRRLAENSFDYMYNPKEAEKYLGKAFNYFSETTQKDTIYLIEMLEFSGYMKILSRDYEEAIKTNEKGLKLFDELKVKSDKDLELKSKIYYNMALLYNAQFMDIPQKEYQYTIASKEVLEQMESLHNESIINTYRRLALFEREYNNYESSINYINKALKLYKKHQQELSANPQIGFKLEFALYRSYLTILMDKSEQGDRSEEQLILENLREVIKITQENQLDEVEKANYKGILSIVTRYYLGHNLPGEAEKYNNLAKKVVFDSKKAPYSLETFNQQVKIDEINILFQKKHYQQALDLIDEAEKTGGNLHDQRLLELKAECLFSRNKLALGYEVINQILIKISNQNITFKLPESEVQNFVPGEAISDAVRLVRLAESFREYYGEYSSEEEKLYWLALAQFQNNIGNTPLNKTLKNTFDKITAGLINSALERPFSDEENNQLLNFIEKVSSQEFINKFLLKREIAGSTQHYNLIEEEQYLRAYITYLKKEYLKQKEETLKQQIFEKELELKKVTEKIATQYKSNNPFVSPAIDIKSLTGENIIKFKALDNQLFKITIREGNITYTKLENYNNIKQEIEHYLESINNLNVGINDLKKQGAHLYKKLFTNDFDTAATVTTIIPDDVLHYLPFDLLVKDNKYLVENYTISYTPSLYFIAEQTSTPVSSKAEKAIFFAPEYSGQLAESKLAVRGEAYSLLGAKEEVTQISSFIEGDVYIGNQASKTQFKSLENNVSVIHLAMHSNLNDKAPELSNLVFSDSEQDYEMYISELYGLSFNANLAVLSACNTGIGGFKDGGNLVSMHYAFTTAGIPSTVASLWNAPDLSTKEIMVAFYKNLQNGENKATALQNAKLDYLKNTTNANLQHPFYWAGFVLSGDKTPILLAEKSEWTDGLWLALIVIAILILVYAYFKKIKK